VLFRPIRPGVKSHKYRLSIKIFSRFTRFIFAILALSGIQPQAFAGLSAKPWCESRFQKDPREIIAFREDLADFHKIKARETKQDGIIFWGEINTTYGAEIIKEINTVFAKPRYANIEPEMRARLIAYLLVREIRIPTTRDKTILAVSTWLKEKLSMWTDLSPADVGRIQIAYKIFLGRKPQWRDRPHRIGAEIVSAMADLGMSYGIDHLWTAAASTIIPGATFIYFPIFILGRRTYLLLKRPLTMSDLSDETKREIIAVEQKFFELSNAELDSKEFQKRWNRSLDKVVNKTGSEPKDGVVLGMVNETCLFLESSKKEELKSKAVESLAYMAESMKAINPIDWLKVRDVFLRIKASATTLGITEIVDIEKIQRAMKSVLETWTANSVAKKTINDIIDGSWTPQPLPTQE
jgi:hypothetical protein